MRELLEAIRTNLDAYTKACKDKAIDLDCAKLLTLDDERRALRQKVEEARKGRNAVSQAIGEKRQAHDPELIAKLRVEKAERKEAEAKLAALEEQLETLLLLVPNLPAADAPRGEAEKSIVLKTFGKKPRFSFPPKDHLALGTALNIIDVERGAAVSGFRGYYLKNEAVLLQQALLAHAMKKMKKAGFTLMIPPTIVKEFALVGSGHFPASQEEIYRVVPAKHLGDAEKEGNFLVGTSEPSLLAYYANTVLDESQLPILLCGISPCYRSEAGSYGKDAKGLFRVHEFMKVEQVVICKNDLKESEKWFAKLLAMAEGIVKDLALPYRILDIATQDMGAGKYRMFDVETWMPSRNAYGETHSNSMLTDWQARRLNLRYKDSQGKIHYAHTLNNTALATPRILVPLLENHQQKDGSVRIPKVLQAVVGSARLRPTK